MRHAALPVVLIVASCTDFHAGLREQVLAAGVPRPLALRFSDAPYASCAASPAVVRRSADSSTVGRTDCRTPPATAASPDRLARVAARVGAALSRSRDADALRAAALLDLAEGPPEMHARAVAELEEARSLGADGPGLDNDLAVAYAVRAADRDDPTDLLRALDVVQRLAQGGRASAEALYNRALILDHLALRAEAESAWRAYLLEDPSGDWAAEGRRRLAADLRLDAAALALRAPLDARSWPTCRAAAEAAARVPEAASEFAAGTLLGAWGQAVLSGDSVTAGRALARADCIGRALSRHDASIARAVATIRRARRDAAVRATLARGHVAYARGYDLFSAGRFADAAGVLRQAATCLRTEPGFRWWPALLLGGVELYAGHYSAADSLYDVVLRAADGAGFQSVMAQAHSSLGLSYGRQGWLGRAAEQYRAAATLYTAEGDRASLGSVELLQGEVAALQGQDLEGARRLYRALADLHAEPSGPRLHDGLLYAGGAAADRGLAAAAVLLHREGLAVARHTGRAKDVMEVLVRLAKAEERAGERDSAAAHLARARAASARLEDPIMRDRLAAEMADAEGELLLRSRPAQAVEPFSRELAYFRGKRNPTSVVRALTRRSTALERSGDAARAAADLSAALAIVDSESRRVQGPLRSSFLEAAVSAFDAMIAVELGRHRPDLAFEYLERSRGTAGRLPAGTASIPIRATARDPDVATSAPAEMPPAALAARLPRGRAVLDYALLSDRLLIWAIVPGRVEFRSIPIGMDSMTALVDRFDDLLRAGTDSTSLARQSARLYELLIGPVEAAIEPAQELFLVPDRALHRLPFGALRRSGDAHFLVEAHPLTSVSTAAAAIREHDRTPSLPVLAVGITAGDSTPGQRLPPLPGAGVEAAEVGRLYPGATVLLGGTPTRAAVLHQLTRAGLFHFAGHARFQPDAPERSYLVVAPERDGSPGLLRASDIRALRLDHLSLVVLSACSTGSRADTRVGGLGGLAQAFLSAGAGGVVGTLWEVDDDAARKLVLGFHRSLLEGLDPAHALRNAQLLFIHSAAPLSRAPSTWAAFQFQGG